MSDRQFYCDWNHWLSLQSRLNTSQPNWIHEMHHIRHRRCAIIFFYQCNLFLQPFPFFADLRASVNKKAKLNQEKSYGEMAFKMMNKCKVAFTVSLLNSFNIITRKKHNMYQFIDCCLPVCLSYVYARYSQRYAFMKVWTVDRREKKERSRVYFSAFFWFDISGQRFNP